MKFTLREVRETRTQAVEVADGPIRDQPYSRSGRRYRVDRVVVSWSRDGGESWHRSVAIRGPVLLKDGGDSKNRTDERWYGSKDVPDWLAEIIAATHPESSKPVEQEASA